MSVTVDRSVAACLVAAQRREDLANAERSDYLATTVCDRLKLERPVPARASLEIGSDKRESLRRAWWKATGVQIAPSAPAIPGSESHPVLCEDGHLRRVGDADESVPFLGAVQQTRDFRFVAKVESVYQRICREETGQVESPAETAKREKKEARLRAQGHTVCRALESVGKVGYRESAWKLWTVDVHEFTVDETPNFRRICINPWIAYRLRMPVLNWLEYWLQDHDYCRFWTFTSGERCRVDALEDRLYYLHRKVSKLNDQPFMKRLGVEVVFRSTELGTVERSDRKADLADAEEMAGAVESDSDGHWYHPHAHCIVLLKKGKIPSALWSDLLAKVHIYWAHQWDEGKRIRNARECVKYVVKPQDMVRLAETDAAELGRLHEVLFKKKLVQPMGRLARDIAAANKAGLIPKRVWINDTLKWTLIRDPNRSYVQDGSEKSGFKDVLGNDATNSAARNFVRLNHKGPRSPDDTEPDVCNVIARCCPAFNSRGVKSPRVVVMGTRLDFARIAAHPLVKRIRSATRADYETGLAIAAAERGELPAVARWTGREARGLGSGISLDNGTPTVRPPDDDPWFSGGCDPGGSVPDEILALY